MSKTRRPARAPSEPRVRTAAPVGSVIDTDPLPDSVLTPRGTELFESLVGYGIQSAHLALRQQPRRSVPLLLRQFRILAATLDARFPEYVGRKLSLDLRIGPEDAPGVVTRYAWQMHFELPATWASDLSNGAHRLLGQRFLRGIEAKKAAAEGKKRARGAWRERIEEVASRCARRHDPAETIGALVSRVHEELSDAVNHSQYDTVEVTVNKAPSRRVVADRLRELGFSRGKYP